MNRLAGETSPYLRQHAANPVDWLPWGEEAFARARELDRPLLVSIGYSACHWCHVMAHESFEDEEVAAKMNAGFVPVKVDREERPDVDTVYLEAVQALTGRGGWPLTVFATPDGRPFFGGTYFPPRPVGGTPAFTTVLEAVERAWRDRREELTTQAGTLTEAIADRLLPPPGGTEGLPPAAALRRVALERFRQLFDGANGGIGGAPKFPQAPLLELVLRAHLAGEEGALPMVESTLGAMAAGGIYDQLDGGFARYSVDAAWQVPHFEKMLYDQASLARCYLHAWQVTGDPRWRQVLDEVVRYVLSDLAAPGGGLCSSEDADAEGEEGRFSTWTPEELAGSLGPERGAEAAAAYGVSPAGNFEHGRSVLHRPPGQVLRDGALESLRAGLAAARARRVRPGRDDKVLTEWNAMFCSALAEAASATGEGAWREAAVGIGEHLLARHRRADGRFLRSYHEGRAQHLAVAADYAWVVDAFTRLGECTGEARWTLAAAEAAGGLVALFSAEDGGWYTTGADAEQLVVRARDTYDGVTPAAGSVAAVALARLGALLADEALLERARASIRSAAGALLASPLAFPHLLLAAELLEDGPLEIVVPGTRPDLTGAVGSSYLPTAVLAWGQPTGSPLFEDRREGLAYVCRRGTCLAPVEEPEALLAAVRAAGASGAGASGMGTSGAGR